MEQTKELVVQSKIKAGQIITNYAEMKDVVREMLNPYRGLIFDESNYKEGKETAAKIRKFRTDLDNDRKSLKKDWMTPYNEAEALMKEVLAEIDEPLQHIDEQLKAVETRRIEQKWEEILELKEQIMEEKPFKGYKDFIATMPTFDNPRWENAGFTMKKIEEEIRQKVKKIVDDCTVISRLESVHSAALFSTYAETMDLTHVMLRKEQLEAHQERLREVKEEASKPVEEPAQEATEVQSPPEATIEYRIRGTKDQHRQLMQRAKELGMKIIKMV